MRVCLWLLYTSTVGALPIAEITTRFFSSQFFIEGASKRLGSPEDYVDMMTSIESPVEHFTDTPPETSDFIFSLDFEIQLNNTLAILAGIPADRAGLARMDWGSEIKPNLIVAFHEMNTDLKFRSSCAFSICQIVRKFVDQIFFGIAEIVTPSLDGIREITADSKNNFESMRLAIQITRPGNYTFSEDHDFAVFTEYANRVIDDLSESLWNARSSHEQMEEVKFDTIMHLLGIGRELQIFVPTCSLEPLENFLSEVLLWDFFICRQTFPYFLQTSRAKFQEIQTLIDSSISQRNQ